MAETIQKFPFDTLPKYSSRHAILLNDLAHSLPAQGFEMKWVYSLSGPLEKYLRKPLRAYYESIFESSLQEWLGHLPQHMVCLSVFLGTSQQRVLVEVDSKLCFMFISQLLGGSDPIAELKPLTLLEEGLIQFLAVKILQSMDGFKNAATPSFRFDRIYQEKKSLGLLFKPDELFVLLTFRLRFADETGYLRLIIPQAGLTQLRNSSPFFAQAERDYENIRLNYFAPLQTMVWAEIGVVELTADDLDRLEAGDIVLFDSAYPQMTGKILSGSVKLRIGPGESGGISAEIHSINDSLQVKLGDVIS